MRAPIYQVDAFTRRLFAGNPAAVVVLPTFPPEAVMQSVAAENNLAETAFLVRQREDYAIRWFTPAVEVPLCGHATLASAAVVMERLEPGRTEVLFQSASGPLPIAREGEDYRLDFPSRPSKPGDVPAGLAEALGAEPEAVLVNAFNYMAVFGRAAQVRALKPDTAALMRIDRPGVIVTAPGDDDYDFVSRYFAPRKGISEDPVTGAAHCTLAPYWAERTGKDSFKAWQASTRGGEVLCRLAGDRVEIRGGCVFYLEGEIEL